MPKYGQSERTDLAQFRFIEVKLKYPLRLETTFFSADKPAVDQFHHPPWRNFVFHVSSCGYDCKVSYLGVKKGAQFPMGEESVGQLPSRTA
jgi:hypothetical protein